MKKNAYGGGGFKITKSANQPFVWDISIKFRLETDGTAEQVT